jgi:hypothetical protein
MCHDWNQQSALKTEKTPASAQARRPFERLRGEIDSLFEDFFGGDQGQLQEGCAYSNSAEDCGGTQGWKKDRRQSRLIRSLPKVMSSGADISTLYREFTQALTDVLAEHAVGPASRGRLARARAVVKKHCFFSGR